MSAFLQPIDAGRKGWDSPTYHRWINKYVILSCFYGRKMKVKL